MAASQTSHRRSGLLRLALVIALLLFFMHVGSPFLIAHIPALKTYADAVDETGIVPGSLFYTDVPQTVDGEMNNRDSIKYFSGKDRRE